MQLTMRADDKNAASRIWLLSSSKSMYVIMYGVLCPFDFTARCRLWHTIVYESTFETKLYENLRYVMYRIIIIIEGVNIFAVLIHCSIRVPEPYTHLSSECILAIIKRSRLLIF